MLWHVTTSLSRFIALWFGIHSLMRGYWTLDVSAFSAVGRVWKRKKGTISHLSQAAFLPRPRRTIHQLLLEVGLSKRSCLRLSARFATGDATSSEDASDQDTLSQQAETNATTVSEEVQDMATFVANRLGRILVTKKLKGLSTDTKEEEEEQQQKEEEENVVPVVLESTTTATPDGVASIETASETQQPIQVDDVVTDTTPAVTKSATPTSTDTTPVVTESATPTSSETNDSLLPEEVKLDISSLEGEVEKTMAVGDVNNSNQTLQGRQRSFTGNWVTLVPEIPSEISLSNGHALEVIQERIPPLQSFPILKTAKTPS